MKRTAMVLSCLLLKTPVLAGSMARRSRQDVGMKN